MLSVNYYYIYIQLLVPNAAKRRFSELSSSVSGIMTIGSPPSKIDWTFTPKGGVAEIILAGEVLSITADVSGKN